MSEPIHLIVVWNSLWNMIEKQLRFGVLQDKKLAPSVVRMDLKKKGLIGQRCDSNQMTKN